MDTETPCRAWLKGDCWKHRKGSCDLAHIKKFCQNGTNCKDETCLNGFQKRHVLKCSERPRWNNGDKCKFPQKWPTCSYYHPELARVKVRKKECQKCDKNEKQIKALKSTIETMKNGLNTNSINLVSSENTSEQSLVDKITDNVLKKIRAELIKEEPAGEEMQNLTKEFEKLKAKHEAFEKEVKSVRQSVDNWKKDVNNRYEQIMNDVDRKINNKVGALVKAKKELNDDAQAITQSIKQEVFQLDKVGRKSVIDEITKAKNNIIDHVSEELGVDDLEGPNLKEAFVNNLKN